MSVMKKKPLAASLVAKSGSVKLLIDVSSF